MMKDEMMILSEDLILQGLEQIRKSQEQFLATAKDAQERVKAAETSKIAILKTIQGWIVHARYNANTSPDADRMTICENLIATIETYCKEQTYAGKRQR